MLAYDVRQFEDKRKVYNPALPNPVLHLSSREFCQHAAGVYAANGIHSHHPAAGQQRYLPTPELSFTHPPPAGARRAEHVRLPQPARRQRRQVLRRARWPAVPPEDQIMGDLVEQVTAIKHVAVGGRGAQREGALPRRRAAPGVHRPVPQAEPGAAAEARRTSVVFTPLHGGGGFCAGEVLEAQGFRPIPVPEQMTPDGQFPNVTKTPNPEVPECMDRAEQRRRREHERRPRPRHRPGRRPPRRDGLHRRRTARARYRFITGNEIAALLTHFKLAQLARSGRCRRRRSSSPRR